MSLMDMFRRNSLAMVGLLMLAMFSFVALPMLQQYLQKAGPGMSDPVLASFDGIPLTASRVQNFTQQHNATVRYLTKLAKETVRRGGAPKIPGFQLDPRTGDVRSLGINDRPSENASIRTLQFAAQAQKEGFELDDTSLNFWMERFTDGKISERDMYGLLRKETNNRMGQLQLFDMLRKQLLSQLFFQAATATVQQGQFAVQSPLDHWRNFLKLQQNATVSTYGVLVNDYVSKTDANPSESEILAVYEDGKNRYPNEQSPEPGFARRETANFEFVMAELQSFRDAEIAKLSEEEIRAEYEKGKAGGAFQLPPESTEPAEASSSEDKADTEPAKDDAAEKAEEMKEDSKESTESEETKADSTQKEEPKEEPAEEEAKTSGDTAAEKKQVEEFAKELEEAGKLPEADGEAPESEDQSSINSDNGVRLVVTQNEQEAESSDEEASDKQEEAAEEKPADDKEEEPASEDKPAEEEKKPEFRPFEEVRDQVAQSMVENTARVALDQAITKVRNVMSAYRKEMMLYNGGVNEGAVEPERPDLEKMAEELGLKYRAIGPFDPVAIAEEQISESVEAGTGLSRRGLPFRALMYGVPGQVNKQVLFREVVTVDLQREITYLTWKTEEKETYAPELEDVRDEVIDAIRVAKARELARQAAEALAEKANSGTPLEDLVPEDRKDNLKNDIGPFSWMTQIGMAQFGFVDFTISEIQDLDSVGDDFMNAVFSGPEDEIKVAPNDPKRVYYVIQVNELTPPVEDLHEMFAQPNSLRTAAQMNDGSAPKVQQGFYEAIDQRSGFKVPEQPVQ